MHAVAFRLHPGDDLKQSLMREASQQKLQAAVVLTCVGSLKQACIRFADQPDGTTLPGPWEIVSLTGTISPDGAHLHIAVSDSQGRTLGGHVTGGCIVYTTAEVCLGELDNLRFSRDVDPATTFKELVVHPR